MLINAQELVVASLVAFVYNKIHEGGFVMKIFYKKVFKLARLAGQILLESNAEEYRVEDTTVRILQTTGLDSPSTYSNATGLFISLTDSELTEIDMSDIVRINERHNDIQRIVQVNEISRDYVSGKISVDQAYLELKHIQKDDYGPLFSFSLFALIILFVVLLGGNLMDILLAGLIGLLIMLLEYSRKYVYLTKFASHILMVSLGTFFIRLVDFIYPATFHPVILLGALIMPFYPVTSSTNAMRDILKGNNLAGIIKGLDAVMVLISLTIGYTLGLILSQMLTSLF